MIDVALIGRNFIAFEKARNDHDFSGIIALLRENPDIIEPYIFNLIADHLEGKLKRPRGRPVAMAESEKKWVKRLRFSSATNGLSKLKRCQKMRQFFSFQRCSR